MNSPGVLADVPVAIFGVGAGCGSDLALGLSDRGAPLALLCRDGCAHERELAEQTAADAGSAGRAVMVAAYDPTSADSVAAAIGKAGAQLGGVPAIVDVANPGPAAGAAILTDVDEAGWDARVTTPLRDVLHRMQGSYRALRSTGGRIVVLLPSLSMSGAPGMVSWTTLSEGHRALAKVAARAWGAAGITVNCVGIPAHLLARQAPQDDPLDRPGLPALSLGRQPQARAEIAAAIAGLLGAELAFVTGATLAVDGGVWMTP